MPDVSSSLSSSDQTAMQPPMDTSVTDAKSVIDLLFAEQLLTKEQYDEIKVKSATAGQSPTQVLQSMHIVAEDKIAQAQAKLLGIPYISLATVSFSPQALGFLARGVVDRFLLIPFAYDDKTKTLSVAMANPIDLDAIGFIRQKTGLIIKTFAAGFFAARFDINYAPHAFDEHLFLKRLN